MLDLRSIAVNAGYGYKAANLFNLHRYGIQVPKFEGISSNILLNILGEEILIDWQKIQEKIAKTKGLDDDIKKDLKALRDKINNAIIDKQAELTNLWKGESKYIIVRSTGMEDSEELSNAGGNDSIPYVDPKNPKDVVNAISLVCQSYFSEKSIQQRLDAEDKTVTDINTKPFVPVLLQEMIESPVINKNNITFSGVAVIGSQNFGEHIKKINVGLGNNAGIVNSIVPTDEILITDNNNKINIFKYVGIKNTMYNTENNDKELKILPVPEDLRDYSIPDNAIKKLNEQLDKIKSLYGNKPLDIEFTLHIIKNKVEVNILQVRPLIEKKAQNRTFAPPEKVNALNSVACKVVTSGKEVVFIENSKDVLFANSIGQALNESYNKKNIKCVVVKNRPSALSHEAIVFNSRGIPVVYIEDELKYNKTLDLVKKSNRNNVIMLDQQLGSIIESKSDITKAKEFVKEGNYSYPISRGFFKANSNKENETKFINFLKTQKPADAATMQNFKQSPTQALKNIISTLKEANTKNEFSIQSELILQILQHTAGLVMKADPSNQFLKAERAQLINIHNELTRLLELVNNIGISRNERLLYIENINSLLLNMNTEGNVNSGSLANILYKVGSFQKAKKSNPNQSNAKAEIKAIGSIVARTPEIEKHFNNLVDKENDNKKIINNIVEMQKGNMLDSYINIYLPSCNEIEDNTNDNDITFQQQFQTEIKNFETSINGFAGKEYQSLQDKLTQLTQEFMEKKMIQEKGMSQFLFASNASQLLDIWDRCIKKFRENPDCNEVSYLDFIRKFQNNFAQKLFSNCEDKYSAFLEHFANIEYVWNQELLKKYIIEDNVEAILAELEAQIKVGNNKYNHILENYNNPNSVHFQDKKYVIDKFTDVVQRNDLRGSHDNLACPKRYLASIQTDFFKNKSESKIYFKGLDLSESFNVQKILPSQSSSLQNAHRLAVKGSQPKTIEDLFTFIHQLSSEGISSIMNKYASLEKTFPQTVSNLLTQNTDFKVCTNLALNNNSIELKFLHTLGTHSASTSISFDKKNQEWKVKFYISGPGGMYRHNYLPAIMSFGTLALEQGIMQNSEIQSSSGSCEFSFKGADKFEPILYKISEICEIYRGEHKDISKKLNEEEILNKYTEIAKEKNQAIEFEYISRIHEEPLKKVLGDDTKSNELRLKACIALICKLLPQTSKSKEISDYAKKAIEFNLLSDNNKDELLSYIRNKVENMEPESQNAVKESLKEIITFPQEEKDEPAIEAKSAKESNLDLSIKNLTEGQNAIIINNQQIARTKETDKQKIQAHIEKAIELTALELKIERKEVEKFLDKLSDVYKSKLNLGNLSSGNKEGFQSVNLAEIEKTKQNSLISKTLQQHNQLNTIEGKKYQSEDGSNLGIRSYRLALIRDALKSNNTNQK